MGGSRANPNKRENKQSTPKKIRQKLRERKKKIKIRASSPRKSCWSVEVEVPLNFLSGPRRPCVGCLLFLLAASLAFFKRFSSSEPDANSSETYSSTTFQPSALLSAILIRPREMLVMTVLEGPIPNDQFLAWNSVSIATAWCTKAFWDWTTFLVFQTWKWQLAQGNADTRQDKTWWYGSSSYLWLTEWGKRIVHFLESYNDIVQPLSL